MYVLAAAWLTLPGLPRETRALNHPGSSENKSMCSVAFFRGFALEMALQRYRTTSNDTLLLQSGPDCSRTGATSTPFFVLRRPGMLVSDSLVRPISPHSLKASNNRCLNTSFPVTAISKTIFRSLCSTFCRVSSLWPEGNALYYVNIQKLARNLLVKTYLCNGRKSRMVLCSWCTSLKSTEKAYWGYNS